MRFTDCVVRLRPRFAIVMRQCACFYTHLQSNFRSVFTSDVQTYYLATPICLCLLNLDHNISSRFFCFMLKRLSYNHVFPKGFIHEIFDCITVFLRNQFMFRSNDPLSCAFLVLKVLLWTSFFFLKASQGLSHGHGFLNFALILKSGEVGPRHHQGRCALKQQEQRSDTNPRLRTLHLYSWHFCLIGRSPSSSPSPSPFLITSYSSKVPGVNVECMSNLM